MGQFKARYSTKEEWLNMIPSVNPTQTKTTSVQNFYTSNFRMKGIAFYEAYEAAMESMDSRELCTNVGSMLCDFYDGFRSSVEEALYRIGARPTVVLLPSNYDIAGGFVWPFMLVNFCCCIIMLLKKFTDEVSYITFMINFIDELKEIIGYDANWDFPFDFKRANEIRTNLGSCSRLCQDTIRFIMEASRNLVKIDKEIADVCQYLCNALAWSEMHHFRLINDMLVKPKSPVLFRSAVSREVKKYIEACNAISSHICPQFFTCLAPKVALSKVDPSRFPTLIAVAQELQRRDNNFSTAGAFELTSIDRADPTIVHTLVKLHRKLMPHNRRPV
ncbi:unnamed protein product [Trifolium pratense]|uniref:Uncharacterized protein n=1 Tax=Trifolium pratense TaxID=57577 RepID=A0ACB0L219_TRIPR|nr:unnamed protein product [Trifolium pratense]